MMNFKIAGILILILIIELTLFGCGGDSSTGLLANDFLINPTSDSNTNTTVVTTNSDGTSSTNTVIPSSVTGYVLDYKTLKPVVGAKVKLDGFLTTYTDNSGYFAITNIYVNLSSGEISVTRNITISAPTYNELSEQIALTPGTNISTSFRLERQTGIISGLVISNGIPVQNATIKIADEETTTNVNGYYTFTNVPVGVHEISVIVNGVLRLSSAVEIKQDFQNLNINLDNSQGSITKLASIDGLIKDSESKALLDGIIVTVSGYPSVISGTNTSGSIIKGYYKINNIPVGKRTITFIDPSGKYYDYSKTVDLVEGENNLDIEMIPKDTTRNELSNVVGIVYGANGELIPNILLRLRPFDAASNNYKVYECTSEVDGWYNFVDIPQGRYILTAQDTRNPKVYPDYFDDQFVVEDGTNYKIINLSTATTSP